MYSVHYHPPYVCICCSMHLSSLHGIDIDAKGIHKKTSVEIGFVYAKFHDAIEVL